MQSSPVTLRHATARDAARLSALHGGCFDEAWSAASIVRVLNGTGAGALIAHDDDDLGFAIHRTVAGEAELLTIGVLPRARRHGVATRLVAAVLDRAAVGGASRLYLEVARDNRAARALYARHGFRQVGWRKGYYDNGRTDALTMAVDPGQGISRSDRTDLR
ncbi:MAG: GNAT family N-acetyltransferase [Rhodospirillales bacterium]|nr:GNAT family N-acetyltransferase [Rhodospirillales bacterium]